jgi:hypothetical protein
MSAVAQHRTFRVRYPTVCFDDRCADALVGGQDGHVYILHFVGGSSSGSVDLLHQTVMMRRCVEPIAAHPELLASLECVAR